jgi:HPt (histidine-containing phosphotransfer) domain-containing protein
VNPAIDHAHLAAQTGGDGELAQEVLGLFARQCRELLPRIVDAASDARARADLAHTLKGSALGVGAVAVARASGLVENALRRGDPATRSIRGLEECVSAAVDEIVSA